MVVGGHGNLLTGTQLPALVVKGPDGVTATVHILPTGVRVAVEVAHGQAIVTNVPLATVDVNIFV